MAKLIPMQDVTNPHAKSFHLTLPQTRPEVQTSSFVFASPHSGGHIPADMLSASHLSRHQLLATQDSMVDVLFAGVVDAGAPLIAADYARSYVDLNRSPDDLDPAMFEPTLAAAPSPKDSKARIGLGVIPRIVSENKAIHPAPIPQSDIDLRLGKAYFPYHKALRNLLEEAYKTTGQAILIDCHSMPSKQAGLGEFYHLPDVVLGDLFGKSCRHDLMEYAEQILSDLGLTVRRNRPYAGGFCTQHYGKPEEHYHALQIELNRSLYLDEQSREPNHNFRALQEILTIFAEKLHGIDLASRALAAE